MAIYYFDLRDGDEIVPDEEGLELQDLLAVQEEAARALASLSWDAVRNFKGMQSRKMSIVQGRTWSRDAGQVRLRYRQAAVSRLGWRPLGGGFPNLRFNASGSNLAASFFDRS